MDAIVKQYGQAILTAVAVLVITVMVFVSWPGSTENLLGTVGHQAATQIEGKSQHPSGLSAQKFEQIAAKPAPTAKRNSVPVDKSSYMFLTDLFEIKGGDGNVITHSTPNTTLEVKSIVDEAGTEWVTTLSVFTSDGRVLFPHPGVFTVKLRVVDTSNQAATYLIPVVVDL